MTTLNVQFTDSSQKIIQSYFASEQDPSIYPNLGTVDATDPRWLAFYNQTAGEVFSLPPAT